MTYDLIIIGAGPAGLTSAIYAARYNLKVLVIGSLPGGLASEAHKVCNFPTYETITGFELTHKMVEQVQNMGVEIKHEVVEDLQKIESGFEIKTNKETYSTKKLILATGTKHRRLGLSREAELLGKGVSYCATCDAGFYKDKIVSVVGGGNAALTAALLIAQFASKVYIIYRRDKFYKAEPAWVKEVEKTENIEVMFESNVTKLLGEEKLESLEINERDELKSDGLFVEIGSTPQTELAEKLGINLDEGYIEVDKQMKTNVQGVFSAGDVTNNSLKQIITACGEGAIAAFSAYEEIAKSTQ